MEIFMDMQVANKIEEAACGIADASTMFEQIVNRLIKLEAMKAANEYRKIRGESPAYGENDFLALLRE
jgi:hypothetical protein